VAQAAFEGGTLAGVAVVDKQPIASRPDLTELKFLHVSQPYRGTGVGAALFGAAAALAVGWGFKGLYVSGTPSDNTVHFYQRRGCVLAMPPDSRLFELEPEDIHFEWRG